MRSGFAAACLTLLFLPLAAPAASAGECFVSFAGVVGCVIGSGAAADSQCAAALPALREDCADESQRERAKLCDYSRGLPAQGWRRTLDFLHGQTGALFADVAQTLERCRPPVSAPEIVDAAFLISVPQGSRLRASAAFDTGPARQILVYDEDRKSVAEWRSETPPGDWTSGCAGSVPRTYQFLSRHARHAADPPACNGDWCDSAGSFERTGPGSYRIAWAGGGGSGDARVDLQQEVCRAELAVSCDGFFGLGKSAAKQCSCECPRIPDYTCSPRWHAVARAECSCFLVAETCCPPTGNQAHSCEYVAPSEAVPDR